MDAYEATRIVYSRVQAIDPDHASKVMGYLLLQDDGDQEMLRLAFGHDALLQAMVIKAKKELGLSSSTTRSPTLFPATAPLAGQQFSSPAFHHFGSPGTPAPLLPANFNSDHLGNRSFFFNEQDEHLLPMRQSDPAFLNDPDNHSPVTRLNNRLGSPEPHVPTWDRFSDHRSHSEMNHLSFFNELHKPPYLSAEYVQPDALSYLNGNLGAHDNLQPRFNGKRFPTGDLALSPDSVDSSSSAWKPCLYFARGFCKHGSHCKFLHSYGRPDCGFYLNHNIGQLDSGSDDGILNSTLERLEFELQELLRGRKAPISIASLPQLYYERFGKILQANGYLTESQRHGKAGFSLTKLLARLKNSVTLIDRPHGQHAVVLSEDAFKFTDYRGGAVAEKEEMNPGSRQIYLTFPAESAFTEEDVSSYFRVYGPVQDVRIPFQQKRMFGFVTFVYPETVKTILAKGNPHYICGARVLVKPYKEKGKHADRKLMERDYLRFMAGQGLDNRTFDNLPGFSGPRFLMEHDAALRKQVEEQEMIVLEMERKRLMELHLQSQRRQQLQMVEHEQPPVSLQAFSESASVASDTMPTASQLTAPSTQQVSSASGTDVDEASETSKDAGAGLKPIQTSSALDILADSLALDVNGKEETTEEQDTSDQQSDQHNLPDSPFTSPHKPFSPPLLSSPSKNVVVGPRSGPPGFTIPSPRDDESLNCRMCNGFYVDLVQLDCGHAFCVQCILKVIRVSKEECPICKRHMGSQIVKLMEARRLQVTDIW